MLRLSHVTLCYACHVMLRLCYACHVKVLLQVMLCVSRLSPVTSYVILRLSIIKDIQISWRHLMRTFHIT